MNVYRGAAKTKSTQLATNGRMDPAEPIGKQPNTPHKTKWGLKICYIDSVCPSQFVETEISGLKVKRSDGSLEGKRKSQILWSVDSLRKAWEQF